jgi:U-box domain-containing protein 5
MPARQGKQETSTTEFTDPQQAAVSSSATHTPRPVNIPPEFYDPLTYEIMTLPVLLPCGQTVDRTTLHRYCLEQVSRYETPL